MNEFKRVFTNPPHDWRKQRLGDFLDRVDTRNVVGDQNVLTISAEHGLISQEEFFSRRVASENVAGYYRLVKGDFAYNKSYSRGYPMGAIRRLDRYPSGVVSPLYICFRPSAGASVDSGFLTHYFDGGAIDTQLADVAKEGARNHGLLNVSVRDFFDIETALPPVEEQRCVARILDTLDTTIRETDAQIEKLKAVKQGLLHDLLTRGIDANGQLRLPQSEAPQLYKESPLGWIPKEWQCTNLAKRLARITYGFTSPMPTTDEGPWMLTATDVSESRILYEQARHTTERAFQLLSSKSRPKVGDVLVTKDGTLGRVAVLDRDDVCVNQSVAVLSPKTSADSFYLATYLQSPIGQERMLADSGGSTIKHLYISKLAEMSIPWPEEHEMDAIVSRISGMTARLENEESLLSKFNRQKSGLMDDLLTGRVRATPLLESMQQAAASTGA